MKAMVLNKICDREENPKPQEMANLPDPVPRDNENKKKMVVPPI